MKAFDTETINRSGYGQACLLIKGDNLEQEVKEFPKNFDEIFEFLRGESYFAFNADFDIRAITHPVFTCEEVVEDLALYGVARYKNILLEYIPNKYFCARKMRSREKFEIWDLYQYYDSSLRAAADKYLGAQGLSKLDLSEADYSRIDKLLQGPRRDDIIEYAKRDVAVAYALYENLAGSLDACGITPLLKGRYYSAGYMAMKYLKSKIKFAALSPEQNAAFAKSFYGGFMDYKYLGRVDDVYYYDIKSAYPSVIRNLTSLEGSEFIREKGEPSRSDILYGAFDVIVDMPKSFEFGFLPVRCELDGVETIIYPVGTFRTYCGLEALELMQELDIDFRILESVYFAGSYRPVFTPIIDELFVQRADAKKSLIVKKILNSMYGKFAERREPAPELPERLKKFFPRKAEVQDEYGSNANLAYAAHITEATRIKLWKAARESAGIYFATDGLFSLFPLRSDLCGNSLGEFAYKGKGRAIIFGIGKYRFEYDSGLVEDRFRGFRGAGDIIDRLLKCSGLTMTASIFTAQSFKEFAKSIERSDFNVLKNFDRLITLDERKRVLIELPINFADFGLKKFDSEPIELAIEEK